MATLGLGIQLRLDDDGLAGGMPVPGDAGLIDSVEVGDIFWVEVLAQDKRQNPAGIVGLPLNLSWDSNTIDFLNTPTQFFPTNVAPAELVTTSFPLDRFVNAFDANAGLIGQTPLSNPLDPTQVPPLAPNLDGLRGAALPAAGIGEAIGLSGNFVFSQLQFQALAATDEAPFTMELAGSMSFADADALDGVAALSVDVIQDRGGRPAEATPNDPPDRGAAVTEFITITAPLQLGSLSGFVYADTNLNGTFDADEIGLPNVTITLDDGTATSARTTGPDGWYHFEDLAAGTYSITETQPAGYVNATNSLGTILAPPGVTPLGDPGTVAGDMFSNIVLMAGEHGVDFNFGENLIPTKRMFLASTIPRQEHFTQLDVTSEFVAGTATDDTIVLQATADEIQVTINGNPQPPVAISATKIVVVDAGAGQDTVTLIGSDAAEVAHLLPNSASLRRGTDFTGLNFGLLVINAEDVTANGGAGDDLAVFRDSPTDDEFVAGNGDNSAMLTSADLDLIARALAFERVRAISTEGGADTAAENPPFDFELDLLGDWTLVP